MLMLLYGIYILNHNISTNSIVRTLWMKTYSFLHRLATVFETGDLKSNLLLATVCHHQLSNLVSAAALHSLVVHHLAGKDNVADRPKLVDKLSVCPVQTGLFHSTRPGLSGIPSGWFSFITTMVISAPSSNHLSGSPSSLTS